MAKMQEEKRKEMKRAAALKCSEAATRKRGRPLKQPLPNVVSSEHDREAQPSTRAPPKTVGRPRKMASMNAPVEEAKKRTRKPKRPYTPTREDKEPELPSADEEEGASKMKPSTAGAAPAEEKRQRKERVLFTPSREDREPFRKVKKFMALPKPNADDITNCGPTEEELGSEQEEPVLTKFCGAPANDNDMEGGEIVEEEEPSIPYGPHWNHHPLMDDWEEGWTHEGVHIPSCPYCRKVFARPGSATDLCEHLTSGVHRKEGQRGHFFLSCTSCSQVKITSREWVRMHMEVEKCPGKIVLHYSPETVGWVWNAPFMGDPRLPGQTHGGNKWAWEIFHGRKLVKMEDDDVKPDVEELKKTLLGSASAPPVNPFTANPPSGARPVLRPQPLQPTSASNPTNPNANN